MTVQFPTRTCVEHSSENECVCQLMDQIGPLLKRPLNIFWFLSYLPDFSGRPRIINGRDSNRNTPLLLATAYNHYVAAKALIDVKADVNLPTEREHPQIPVGRTPLWITLQVTHNIALARLFIQSGANVQIEETLDADGKARLALAKQTASVEREALIPLLSPAFPEKVVPVLTIVLEYTGPLERDRLRALPKERCTIS